MKNLLHRLRRCVAGSAAIEAAFAIPLLMAMLIGATTIGTMYEANAGLRHAVGEAARAATVWPTPDDAAIIARVQAKKFGLKAANLATPTVTHGADGGVNYIEVSASYAVPVNFLFMTDYTVGISETRRVYVS